MIDRMPRHDLHKQQRQSEDAPWLIWTIGVIVVLACGGIAFYGLR